MQKPNPEKTLSKKKMAILLFIETTLILMGFAFIYISLFGQPAKDVEYTSYTADELINNYVSVDKTKEKYRGEYVEVEGVLSSIYASDDMLQMTGFDKENLLEHYYIDCCATSSEHEELMKSMDDGDSIKIKGKIVDVDQYCYTINVYEAEITEKVTISKSERVQESSPAKEKDTSTYNIVYSEEPLVRPSFFF